MLNPVLAEQHRAHLAAKARIDAPRVVTMKPRPRAFCPSWATSRLEPDKLRIEAPAKRGTRHGLDANAHIRAYRRHLLQIPVPLGQAYLAAAVRFYGIKLPLLISPSREESLVKPRQVLMYLLRKRTGKSLPAIGRILGNRDHTTVLHGVRWIAAHLDKEPTYRKAIAAIEADVFANFGRLT